MAGGTWFGETAHQERIRRFAREHPELRVDVPGHVDEVVELIDRHDVLLHTSLLPEPFGQVVVQGLARGRVVVAADSGGPAEVITHGHDGLLYRTGDQDDLARTLEQVAAGGPQPAAIRENAVRTARRHHPERTAERLRSVLEHVTAAATDGRRLGILRPVRGLPDQLRLLLTGTRPSRIGFSPGPLTDLRKARHALGAALQTRPLRLCLLEHDTSTMYFAEPTAFWINQRSRVCWAQRNLAPERADLVWVFTQDPLTAEVRAWLDAQLRRVRPGVRVLNPPAVYDAYHEPDCFPRLARAGVRVPRTELGPADVGVTPAVYKAVGEQAARKELCVYDGPRPGFRAAVAHDSRGADGRYRRYRAFVLGDLVLPEDVIVADHWNASLRHLVTVERNYALPELRAAGSSC